MSEHTIIGLRDEEIESEFYENWEQTELEKINEDKPRFYIGDLDNYNEEFLKQIILWQQKLIEYLDKITKK